MLPREVDIKHLLNFFDTAFIFGFFIGCHLVKSFLCCIKTDRCDMDEQKQSANKTFALDNWF